MHLLLVRRLICFHFLAIVNRIEINTMSKKLLWMMLNPFSIWYGVVYTSHMIDLFSAFCEFLTLISIMSVSDFNSTDRDEGFPFPHTPFHHFLSVVLLIFVFLTAIK